mmetsp:Transcript_18862/g.41107  ORF Transcript_18862/g.41107 Transcript_18862/m.41107 type:complete len:102 (-) Transcript_18862:150-455(-)
MTAKERSNAVVAARKEATGGVRANKSELIVSIPFCSKRNCDRCGGYEETNGIRLCSIMIRDRWRRREIVEVLVGDSLDALSFEEGGGGIRQPTPSGGGEGY